MDGKISMYKPDVSLFDGLDDVVSVDSSIEYDTLMLSEDTEVIQDWDSSWGDTLYILVYRTLNESGLPDSDWMIKTATNSFGEEIDLSGDVTELVEEYLIDKGD